MAMNFDFESLVREILQTKIIPWSEIFSAIHMSDESISQGFHFLIKREITRFEIRNQMISPLFCHETRF